jgi:peptidoglycan-associated lipoprotein
MTRPFIRVVFAILLLVLPAAHALAANRVQAALDRAAAAQPRFVPKAPDAVGEFVAAPELKPVHFAFDRADVQRAEAAILDADAAWLRQNPGYAILIAGHADARGTSAYNVALAERRAQALREQLVSRGVRDDRISVVSYGEGMPSCRKALEPCYATNRTAVILVRRFSQQTP